MKVSRITKTVTISHEQVLRIFTNAVYGDAKRASGKDLIFYKAFGSLVGISDKEAVEIANHNTKKEYRITVTEFRRWLPTVFAEFARVMLEADSD